MDQQTASGRRPYTFDRVVRITFSVITLLAVLFLLDLLKGVLLPFLVACLIAYMLEPIVKFNKRVTHLHHRFVPVMLTLCETLVIVGGIGVLIFPYVMSEVSDMTRLLGQYAANKIQIPYIHESIHQFIRDNVDFNQLARMISREEWKEIIKNTVSKSWNFLSSGLAFVIGALSWLIVILYVIFIMLDYERITQGFKGLVPVAHRHDVMKIFHDIETAMNRYFRGQFLIAMMVGILFATGFQIIGLPMGVILGIFIGVLNLVPYLQLISFPVTAFLCLVAAATGGVGFWTIFWESMAVYLIVQCIQDLILTPKIMGKAMGLNPAIILLSLSVWGSLLGFIGLIIALPLTTLLLSYYSTYVVNRHQTAALEEMVTDGPVHNDTATTDNEIKN